MPCCCASNIKTARFIGIILSVLYLLGIIMTFSKGQLISKCPFGVFKWTKNQQNIFKDFCPVRNHVKLMRVINSRRGFSKGTVLWCGYWLWA